MKILCETVDITPLKPCPLGGGESPTSNWETVDSMLEANLILIEDDIGDRLIITLDLLYVGNFLTEGIRRSALRFLESEDIWISATHNHNAPAVDTNKHDLGITTPEYLNLVLKRIDEAISRVFISPERVEVRTIYRGGIANHSINRRKRRLISISGKHIKFNRISMAPNVKGLTDEAIRVLDFVDSSGKLIAMIWQYTCHPVSYPHKLNVSAHFPGVVRDSIRQMFGDIPVLYLNGFSGDVRPRSIRSFKENPLLYVFSGRTFRRFSQSEYDQWTQSLSNLVLKAKENDLSGNSKAYLNKRFSIESEQFLFGSSTKEVIFSTFPIAKVLLVGVSAEPSVEYVQLITKNHSEEAIWPVGCLEDVFGYLPTRKQLREGGYEGGEFVATFGAKSLNLKCFANFQAAIFNLLRQAERAK
jgi:hypothetical protein